MEYENENRAMEAMFINLVAGIYTQTMQFLGTLMNPATGRVEKNIEAARANIELLRMLKSKTSGNLSEKESKSLEDALSNMQLNYVNALEKDGREKKNEKGEESAGNG